VLSVTFCSRRKSKSHPHLLPQPHYSFTQTPTQQQQSDLLQRPCILSQCPLHQAILIFFNSRAALFQQKTLAWSSIGTKYLSFFFQSKEKNMHVCTQLIEEGHSMYRSSLATPQDVVIYSWILSCIVLYSIRPKLLVILIFLNS